MQAGRSCDCSTQPPELTHAVGTNYALIHAAQSARMAAKCRCMVAIDNLVKGAGGQAIQAMNLALGLPEETADCVAPVRSTRCSKLHARAGRDSLPVRRCFPVYAQLPVTPVRGPWLLAGRRAWQ